MIASPILIYPNAKYIDINYYTIDKNLKVLCQSNDLQLYCHKWLEAFKSKLPLCNLCHSELLNAFKSIVDNFYINSSIMKVGMLKGEHLKRAGFHFTLGVFNLNLNYLW